MPRSFRWFASIALLGLATGTALAEEKPRDSSRRMVLVELYTSQGCDMCPEAEAILGALAERNSRIVPIAFHVDYFNNPWKDPFSDALYSKRQMAYNSLYTKPKNPEYGLYYTPMLMIDGEQSINGRDPAGADAAIRQALAKKPGVTLDADLDLDGDARSGTVRIRVSPRSSSVQGKTLLVCAVLREDGVVTRVPSGENGGKTLTARFPARAMKFEYVALEGKSEKSLTFPIRLDPSWDANRLSLAVFAQDKQTGLVYQAIDLPWRPTKPEASAGSRSSRKSK